MGPHSVRRNYGGVHRRRERLPRNIGAPALTNESPISLDYWQLPYYALRTALRMFTALAFSLFFTFTYATLAAKSRRAEIILIPVLDILQSVPILGFLSFTVTFFLELFPGNTLGANSRRSSPSSPAKPGTWPSPSTSRCAPCRAISRKSREAFG